MNNSNDKCVFQQSLFTGETEERKSLTLTTVVCGNSYVNGHLAVQRCEASRGESAANQNKGQLDLSQT